MEATGNKGLLQRLPANKEAGVAAENHSFPSHVLFLPDVFKGRSCAQYLRSVFVFWNKEDLTMRYMLAEHLKPTRIQDDMEKGASSETRLFHFPRA